MKRLCTICARGGSKGVAHKNLRKLKGKSLVAITVEQAKASGAFDAIAVSSDSPSILQEAKDAGADILIERPAALASDEADKSPAIVHCAQSAEQLTGIAFDTFVDLDVTAPLRRPSDIVGVIELIEKEDADNVFSVCPSRRSPYFNMVEFDPSGRVALCKPTPSPILRRQDTPKTFDLNASIYGWRRSVFFENCAPIFMDKTKIFVMAEETAFDLDSENDFKLIEFFYDQYAKEEQ